MTTRCSLLPLGAFLALTGCGTPVALPALPPPATGTRVHISNASPSLPLALYRAAVVEDSARPRARSTGGLGGRQWGMVQDTSLGYVGTSTPRLVCMAPCDQLVDGSVLDELFLGGEGIARSSAFHLPARAAQVEIKAAPQSPVSLTLSAVFLPVGSAGVVGGLVGLGAILNGSPRGTAITGEVLFGVGGALLVTGTVLLITGRTTYSVDQPTVALRF
jgi:hypothetical protein